MEGYLLIHLWHNYIDEKDIYTKCLLSRGLSLAGAAGPGVVGDAEGPVPQWMFRATQRWSLVTLTSASFIWQAKVNRLRMGHYPWASAVCFLQNLPASPCSAVGHDPPERWLEQCTGGNMYICSCTSCAFLTSSLFFC